jgi:hypothetical protein
VTCALRDSLALACALAVAAGLGCNAGGNGRLPDAGVGRDGPQSQTGGSLDGGVSASPDEAGLLRATNRAEGAQLVVHADALVDPAGNRPQFPILLRLQRVPIERYEDMPGAWRTVDEREQPLTQATGGVWVVSAEDQYGRPLALRPGMTFRLWLPHRFTGEAAVLRFADFGQVWRPDGRIVPRDVTGGVEVEAAAFGLWSVAKLEAPRCRSGVLRDQCGGVIPNATLVAFAAYNDLRMGDATTSDGSGAFAFASGYPEPNTSYEIRVSYEGRSLLVRDWIAEMPPACGRAGDFVVPTCDGVECYIEAGLGRGGGDCRPEDVVCPFSWDVDGRTYCTDGHAYTWGCTGQDKACSCGCWRDGEKVHECANRPVSCAERREPRHLCIAGPESCGLPRYVPRQPSRARPCRTDDDCFPKLPHCRDHYCDP